MATITKQLFGSTANGRDVHAYTLVTPSGVQLKAINYGCAITSLRIPDREGQLGEVVLGFDSLDGYLASTHYFGAVIGRVAGRIRHGQLDIDSREYFLTRNADGHHLHGGALGFDKVLWEAEPFENEKGVGVDFRYTSPAMAEGYPGNVQCTVRYYLTHQDALITNYIAVTDAPTILNPTQHTYWNLSAMQDSVLNHGLQINAEQYLPITEEKLPSGALVQVEGTPFDFRQPKLIRDAFDPAFEQVRIGHGLDHCWVLKNPYGELGNACLLYDPGSGRLLGVHTSEPGLQVYTGNALNDYGRDGQQLVPFSGISLETQHFPDAVHHAGFPSIVVRPDRMYQSTTIFQFSTLKA